jgi:hypothetical protein
LTRQVLGGAGGVALQRGFLVCGLLAGASCAGLPFAADPGARMISPVSVMEASPAGSVMVPATLTPFSRSRWIATGTKDFELYTDLPPSRALAVGAHYQTIRAALAHWFRGDFDHPPLDVVVFADPEDYTTLFGKDAGPYVTGWRRPDGAVMAHRPLSLEALNALNEATARGLARRMLRVRYGGLPAWMVDAVAVYLATIVIDGPVLRFRGVTQPRGFALELEAMLPMADLLAVSGPAPSGHTVNAMGTSSWVLVDFLLDQSIFGAEAASRFQTWLSLASESGDARKGFEAAYPEQPIAQLDAVLAGRNRQPAVRRDSHRFAADFVAPSRPVGIAPASGPRLRVMVADFQETSSVGRQRQADSREHARWAAAALRNELRIDLHPIAPLQLMSFGYARSVAAGTAVDLELGWSPLGYSAGLRYRLHRSVGRNDLFFGSAGLGVWLSVKGESLGLYTREKDPPTSDEPESFRHLALNPELAVGVRPHSHLLIKLSVMALLKVGSNMNTLCSNDRYEAGPSCRSGHFPTTSALGDKNLVPFVRAGAGWIW